MGKIQVILFHMIMIYQKCHHWFMVLLTQFFVLDIERKTWNGESFNIESVFLMEKEIDLQNNIYEYKFYQPNLTTMQCEVRERKLLHKMGIGNWIIQLMLTNTL